MRLMERMVAVAARRHLAPRTVAVYRAAFLTHLARARKLGAASQNQAGNAVLFLYRDVLGEELGPEHLGPIVAPASEGSHLELVVSPPG